jgi:hypothetical protein
MQIDNVILQRAIALTYASFSSSRCDAERRLLMLEALELLQLLASD